MANTLDMGGSCFSGAMIVLLQMQWPQKCGQQCISAPVLLNIYFALFSCRLFCSYLCFFFSPHATPSSGRWIGASVRASSRDRLTQCQCYSRAIAVARSAQYTLLMSARWWRRLRRRAYRSTRLTSWRTLPGLLLLLRLSSSTTDENKCNTLATPRRRRRRPQPLLLVQSFFQAHKSFLTPPSGGWVAQIVFESFCRRRRCFDLSLERFRFQFGFSVPVSEEGKSV